MTFDNARHQAPGIVVTVLLTSSPDQLRCNVWLLGINHESPHPAFVAVVIVTKDGSVPLARKMPEKRCSV